MRSNYNGQKHTRWFVLSNFNQNTSKYYPILKTGLIVADVLSVINIVIKAITQGLSSVTIGEWTELALITGTAFFGGKIARRIAKSLIMRALKIPMRALGSFDGFRRFVEAKRIFVFTQNFIKYNDDGQRVLGSFDFLDRENTSLPVLYIYRGGKKLSIIIHEYVHYREWKYFVGGTYYDWMNFSDIGNNYEHLEAIAYFVSDVFMK